MSQSIDFPQATTKTNRGSSDNPKIKTVHQTSWNEMVYCYCGDFGEYKNQPYWWGATIAE